VRGEAEAIPFTTLATVFAAKGGGYSSGKPPHTADVTVNRGGKTVVSETVESGNMTAEEKALGFPQGQNASHTEARAVRNIPLQAGDTMNINGEYAPCPSCRGAMNQAAGASGARIIYSWPGGVFVAGGE